MKPRIMSAWSTPWGYLWCLLTGGHQWDKWHTGTACVYCDEKHEYCLKCRAQLCYSPAWMTDLGPVEVRRMKSKGYTRE